MRSQRGIPLWRDVRVWQAAAQLALVVAIVALVATLWSNLTYNLWDLGIQQGFGFLDSEASFPIGETPIPYDPSDSYRRALLVGFVNFLRAIAVGIPLATVVGVTIGIARLSSNWLVRQLASIYVEVLRNLPLLLQLLFWYALLSVGLPELENRLALPGQVYLSNQGIVLPWFATTPSTLLWLAIAVPSSAIALGLTRWQAHRRLRLGQPPLPWLAGPIAVVGVMAIAVIVSGAIAGHAPLQGSLPKLSTELQWQGGLELSSEFLALLLGLSLYTAAFIAEIVRGGIQAVPKGQWEAAQSLGLNRGLTLRLVVLPQAFRAILPPLTNQYLNLSKNSSLAIAVGYPDFYSVASTTASQRSQTVELVLLILVTYLLVSLAISGVMNAANWLLRKRY